ncbi:MAG: NADPH-dependent ferric siderophore reductase [Burkholderiales bacterium PBB5]|nr:MAG: NADPH-dependent ferric siderophore reductase [Burkholderiales bacterium PBB5]
MTNLTTIPATPATPTTPTTARRVQRVRHELRLRQLQVARVQRLSPGFVSVVFSGDDLADLVSLGFDDHVKFMLDGADGQPVRRDYTPRHVDLARRELTIEFAVHGHGQVSQWACQAQPGMPALIGGPRGSMVVPTDFDWHLLAGDATALPAIHRRLQELPADARVTVLVQLADDADRRDFGRPAPQTTVHWVRSSEAWLQALRQLPWPAGDGFAWCAGEARTMAQARDILIDHHGHPREAMRVSAYWKPGTADFHETL